MTVNQNQSEILLAMWWRFRKMHTIFMWIPEHKGIARQTSLARISHRSKIKHCSATKSTQKTCRSRQPRSLRIFYQDRFQNSSLKFDAGLGAKLHTQTLHIYRNWCTLSSSLSLVPLSSEVDSQRTETTPRWHPTLLLSAWFTANLKEEHPPSEGAHGVQHRLAIPQSNPPPTFRNKKKTQTPEQTSINFFVTPTIACCGCCTTIKPKIPNTQNYTPVTIANPIAV